jgi:hypothetical protein
VTEAEWLASDDPVALLTTLLAVDVTRGDWPPKPTADVRERQLRAWADACRHEFYHGRLAQIGCWSGWESRECYHNRLRDEALPAASAARLWAAEESQRPLRAALLRDVVGNPFRPAYLCGWAGAAEYPHVGVVTGAKCSECQRIRTPAVTALAREVDAAWGYDKLPVLADALEEAGCADAAVLGHCRGLARCVLCRGTGTLREGYVKCDVRGVHDTRRERPCVWCKSGWRPADPPLVHCRGCWVIELLLGRG